MNNFRTKMIIGIVLTLFCLAMVIFTWYGRASASKEYQAIIKQRDGNVLSSKVMPIAENIFLLKKEWEWLVNAENELRILLTKKKINIQKLTPLQFKEELLDAQTKLKQLAGIQGSRIEESLGYSEYAGGEIPEAGQVNLLTKQLEIIKELINIILKYKINEITSIERIPQAFSITDNKGVLCQEIILKIRLQCTYEELLNILKDIINAKYVLVVRSIKMERAGENRIEVELLIGAIELV